MVASAVDAGRRRRDPGSRRDAKRVGRLQREDGSTAAALVPRPAFLSLLPGSGKQPSIDPPDKCHNMAAPSLR